ncbi:uncharacterized protein LOC118180964, partial [Stegodyphus dumicola]|uniref:uncharacterized protein LOC118180964 n=1 Tax=Stegodyphus dumicola TaxID=202533 RepID=UPI0015B210B3
MRIEMRFCNGCANFLSSNLPNEDLYNKISENISVETSKIVLVWQPFVKDRPDRIANHFAEFGAVKNVIEWWTEDENSCEIALFLVIYLHSESASRAEHGLPLVASNVRIMTLIHLLSAATEIESSCKDVSDVVLQVENFPKSEKEKELLFLFNRYVPASDVQRFDQDATKVRYDVTYKYFTHALVAEMSIQ